MLCVIIELIFAFVKFIYYIGLYVQVQIYYLKKFGLNYTNYNPDNSKLTSNHVYLKILHNKSI